MIQSTFGKAVSSNPSRVDVLSKAFLPLCPRGAVSCLTLSSDLSFLTQKRISLHCTHEAVWMTLGPHECSCLHHFFSTFFTTGLFIGAPCLHPAFCKAAVGKCQLLKELCKKKLLNCIFPKSGKGHLLKCFLFLCVLCEPV